MTTTVQINGYTYKLGKSTWHSDHGAMFMLDADGKRINEWNTWTEYDSIKQSPHLLEAYKQLVALSKL